VNDDELVPPSSLQSARIEEEEEVQSLKLAIAMKCCDFIFLALAYEGG